MPGLLAAAHELKAPLVLIRQLALEFEESSGGTETSRRLRYTSERSLRLVSNLTKTARLEDSLFDFEPVEIHSLCSDVAHELLPLAKEYDQHIVLDMPRGSLVSVAHRDLLQALLIGLCDNAIAHNSKGGKVTISARLNDGRVEVAVRDEGPKVASAQLTQLKSRLGQTIQPLGDRPRSSGLGLWIASQFAAVMSSTIGSVSHRKSAGMSFYVSLPKSRQLSLFE
jgi:signal transduction histidine kinase